MRTERVVMALGVLVLAPAIAGAQISPGPLSRAHARLEGSTRCLECHDPSSGASSTKCLACHDALRARINAGRGLHAQPGYGECRECHVEHQGEEYDLVWWGEAGRESFDHGLTGHVLEGRHRQLECDRCHVPPVGPSASGGGSLSRTYIGLGTACTPCHVDQHRGQLAGRSCDECHTQEAWKPAPGFDHARTSWPLTGRHATLDCARCHKATEADPTRNAAVVRVYRGAATTCAGCHEDTHRGRLGGSCETCHSTSGWRGGLRAGFDHARTAYPLEGRHARVACDSCHAPGRPLRMAHGQCTDCHADAHVGQLARRADGGRCESCHDVGGFRPARFGIDAHAKTSYPLTGAHLAVACDRCHRPTVPARGRGGPQTVQLRFTSTRCADCHRDPHGEGSRRSVAQTGCEGCHRVESWQEVAFDHGQTTYPLTGRHADVACAGCHRAGPAEAAPAALRFAGVSQTCQGCHRDPHLGQFDRGGPAACDRCHTTADLRATGFDHDRDSAYRLDGAHRRLECAACHRRENRDGASVVRYRPLPTTCSGCHGAGRYPADGDRS